MSCADAPSIYSAKAKAIAGEISVFLGECGAVKAAGRRQKLYKSHNSLLVDGQRSGRKSYLFFIPPTPSCDKQSAHPEICHMLCLIDINQKSHTMVQK